MESVGVTTRKVGIWVEWDSKWGVRPCRIPERQLVTRQVFFRDTYPLGDRNPGQGTTLGSTSLVGREPTVGWYRVFLLTSRKREKVTQGGSYGEPVDKKLKPETESLEEVGGSNVVGSRCLGTVPSETSLAEDSRTYTWRDRP